MEDGTWTERNEGNCFKYKLSWRQVTPDSTTTYLAAELIFTI